MQKNPDNYGKIAAWHYLQSTPHATVPKAVGMATRHLIIKKKIGSSEQFVTRFTVSQLSILSVGSSLWFCRKSSNYASAKCFSDCKGKKYDQVQIWNSTEFIYLFFPKPGPWVVLLAFHRSWLSSMEVRNKKKRRKFFFPSIQTHII